MRKMRSPGVGVGVGGGRFLEEKLESQGAFLCTSPCIPVPGQSE